MGIVIVFHYIHVPHFREYSWQCTPITAITMPSLRLIGAGSPFAFDINLFA